MQALDIKQRAQGINSSSSPNLVDSLAIRHLPNIGTPNHTSYKHRDSRASISDAAQVGGEGHTIV